MGVQTLIPGQKYRVFVDGLGNAGWRKIYSEVVWSTEEVARKRHLELRDMRDRALPSIRHRKLLLAPAVYARLEELADELGLTPDQFISDIIMEL